MENQSGSIWFAIQTELQKFSISLHTENSQTNAIDNISNSDWPYPFDEILNLLLKNLCDNQTNQ